MIERTNLKDQLKKEREKAIDEDAFLDNIYNVLRKDDDVEDEIRETLNAGSDTILTNDFDIDQLNYGNIFHIDQIEKICIQYRLRFLDSQLFKDDLPYEAIQKVKHLQKLHGTKLQGFKIIAPSKSFRLKNADDPLLFAPIGNGYYNLVHKWGNDLHPMRKLLMWPIKNLENFAFALLILTFGVTALFPENLFTKNRTSAEFLMLAFFLYKCFAGIAIYYGFARGKNFSAGIWNSKYFNA